MMTLDEMTIGRLAALYLDAEASATPVAPIRADIAGVSEAEMYAVQRELVRRKLAGGIQQVGWKAGATTAPAQASFGLSGPSYGVLFDHGAVADGGSIPLALLIHPRVEVEIAFHMAQDLIGPGVTPDQALDAAASVCAAFEVVDPRTRDWDVKMPEMIADNVFQARYVLGVQHVAAGAFDLGAVEAVLTKNGAEVARGTGTNVLGHPAMALAWLANRLADDGEHLRAGQVVLTGTLTPVVSVAAGDTLVADLGALGSVRVRFV
jgi:2-keto-4-pentenoate hydratase